MENDTQSVGYNPPGYTDEFGQKHEWAMHAGSVEHRVDGTLHSIQNLEGFLQYGIPNLVQQTKQQAARTQTPPASTVMGEDEAVEIAYKALNEANIYGIQRDAIRAVCRALISAPTAKPSLVGGRNNEKSQ